MPTPHKTFRTRPAATALVLIALAAFAAAPTTVIAFPTGPVKVADFARSGVLAAGSRAAKVAGPLRCWKGGAVKLRATISQRSTRTLAGAIAEGFWTGRCTGSSQHWQLTAAATDGTTLRPGCAHAAGLVIYRRGGETIDVRQWQSTITLTATRTAGAPTAC